MDELIDRMRRGEATADELTRLDAWRRASTENERAYQDTVRVLDAGRALGSADPTIARPTGSEIVARADARRRFAGRRAVARWTPWVIAAAASIVAAVTLRDRVAPNAASDSGWGATEVVTGATELATVQLGEGSVVRLAPSSRLRVLPGRERAVSLEGRAFFAVQRIPDRPLRVHTRAGEARVLGTRFELVSDAESMQVRVVEGRVALSSKTERIEVAAGEESGVRNGAVARPTPVAPSTPVASWVGTFLAFQATPLTDVGREIERVYKTPVTIADSALARETITATFTDRPVQEVVNVVCSVLSARCELRDGRVRIER
jgi:transmembrane sensor